MLLFLFCLHKICSRDEIQSHEKKLRTAYDETCRKLGLRPTFNPDLKNSVVFTSSVYGAIRAKTHPVQRASAGKAHTAAHASVISGTADAI